MNIKEEIIKNNASIKMNEIRIRAIISLLSKEGIVDNEEVEEEVNKLISQKNKESSEE